MTTSPRLAARRARRLFGHRLGKQLVELVALVADGLCLTEQPVNGPQQVDVCDDLVRRGLAHGFALPLFFGGGRKQERKQIRAGASSGAAFAGEKSRELSYLRK
jgi:hypothetical protein